MKRVACAIVVALTLSIPSSAGAVLSDQFHNKWPWLWTASAVITTLPFQGVHGCYPNGAPPYECVDAYDLVISGDVVLSAAEGRVTALESSIHECGADLHYGNFVDVDGKRYAHLKVLAPSVTMGTPLLQGDSVGTQGATGNVIPCNFPTDQSGKHLHWDFLGSSSTPPIDGGSGSSSNSVVGELSTAGATLRNYYINHGSWNSIGWTYKHCPGTCTLNMTANQTWGRMQDFQHDTAGFGGTFDTIHVPTWNPNLAYLVDSVFWQAWAVGGADVAGNVHAIGMANGERGACPPGSSANCISYQKFDLGFVWMNAFTGRAAVTCLDFNGDQLVNTSDLTLFAQQFTKPPVPPLREIVGNNYVLDSGDLTRFAQDYGHDCHV